MFPAPKSGVPFAAGGCAGAGAALDDKRTWRVIQRWRVVDVFPWFSLCTIDGGESE